MWHSLFLEFDLKNYFKFCLDFLCFSTQCVWNFVYTIKAIYFPLEFLVYFHYYFNGYFTNRQGSKAGISFRWFVFVYFQLVQIPFDSHSLCPPPCLSDLTFYPILILFCLSIFSFLCLCTFSSILPSLGFVYSSFREFIHPIQPVHPVNPIKFIPSILHPSVHSSISMSMNSSCTFFLLIWYVCLSFCLSICCWSVYVFHILFICVSTCLFLCHSVFLLRSVGLSVSWFIALLACLPVALLVCWS